MNLDPIETHLLTLLKRQFGKDFYLSAGPYSSPVFGGLRTEIHIHASAYRDFDGTTPDGAVISRCGMHDSTHKGYREERPGRMTIEITCVAGNYAAMKNCCGLLTPSVLSALGPLNNLLLGATPDGASQLHFDDCHSWLHESATERDHDGKVGFFFCRMVFRVDGFLKVRVLWKAKQRPSKSKMTSKSDTKIASARKADRAKQAV